MCFVRTKVGVQDSLPSGKMEYPEHRGPEGIIDWQGKESWVAVDKKKSLTQTDSQAQEGVASEGLEIYYYSSNVRLVGNSGCGRGEWNRGGVELPKLDDGPGRVPWKSCC